jgi:hypothetical protein
MTNNRTIREFQEYYGWSRQVTIVEYDTGGRVYSTVSGFAVDTGRVSGRPDFDIAVDRSYGGSSGDINVTLYRSEDDWFSRRPPFYRSYRTFSSLTVDLDMMSWEELADGSLRVLHGVKKRYRWNVDVFLHGRNRSI